MGLPNLLRSAGLCRGGSASKAFVLLILSEPDTKFEKSFCLVVLIIFKTARKVAPPSIGRLRKRSLMKKTEEQQDHENKGVQTDRQVLPNFQGPYRQGIFLLKVLRHSLRGLTAKFH